MRNIRLLIAFDGTSYHGWQVQPGVPTIQGEIEEKLAVIHTRQVTLHGAGRTDAGVHARGMVAHFHTDKSISCEDLLKALNSMLPGSIRILEAQEETAHFHSRFSAVAKTYTYAIFNGTIIMPQDRLYTVHIRSELDLAKMGECMQCIIGTHDFAAFETAGSRDASAPCERGSIRTIGNAEITQKGSCFLYIAVTGDGFLRHMVRNIVGTLLEVGLGRRSISGFQQALSSGKRAQAGTTAPAHGLTLEKIYY